MHILYCFSLDKIDYLDSLAIFIAGSFFLDLLI